MVLNELTLFQHWPICLESLSSLIYSCTHIGLIVLATRRLADITSDFDEKPLHSCPGPAWFTTAREAGGKEEEERR